MLKFLLLSFWYQIQGNDKFSLSITQDFTKNANKELVAAAANFRDKKYYQVVRKSDYSEKLNSDGIPNFEVKWNPIDDFNSYTKIT